MSKPSCLRPPLRGAPNSPMSPRTQCAPATGKTWSKNRGLGPARGLQPSSRRNERNGQQHGHRGRGEASVLFAAEHLALAIPGFEKVKRNPTGRGAGYR